MFRLLKNLDQTVEKGGQPQEPFEKSGQHDGAHNRDIDNLPSFSLCASHFRLPRIDSHQPLARDR